MRRGGPARWAFSHVARHKLFIAGILIGALGNAAPVGDALHRGPDQALGSDDLHGRIEDGVHPANVV